MGGISFPKRVWRIRRTNPTKKSKQAVSSHENWAPIALPNLLLGERTNPEKTQKLLLNTVRTTSFDLTVRVAAKRQSCSPIPKLQLQVINSIPCTSARAESVPLGPVEEADVGGGVQANQIEGLRGDYWRASCEQIERPLAVFEPPGPIAAGEDMTSGPHLPKSRKPFLGQ